MILKIERNKCAIIVDRGANTALYTINQHGELSPVTTGKANHE